MACFFSDLDRRFYLKCIGEAAERRGCALHAYVLMSNHVHLLVTPLEAGNVAAMLQDVGRKYVRTVNTLHGRTGTLWQGRFKSSLVCEDAYLLNCHRYIELNPVRAGMVNDPAEYPWSSYAHYVSGRRDVLITSHAVHQSLGINAVERQHAHRTFVLSPIPQTAISRIREALNTNSAFGSDTFLAGLEIKLGRRIAPPVRGRPPAEPPSDSDNAGIIGKLF